MSDFSILNFLYNTSFLSQHLTLDYSHKVSYLDVILINSNSLSLSIFSLYTSHLNDLHIFFSVSYLPFLSFFLSSYQDIFSIILLISPELIISFSDYFFSYYSNYMINPQVSSCFDSYTNNLSFLFGEGLVTFIMFLFFS